MGDAPRSLRIGGDGRLELTDALVLNGGGDIVLAARELELGGQPIITRMGDISLTLPDGAELRADILSGRGNVTITGLGDLGIVGVIEAADGNLELVVAQALTTSADMLLDAPNGGLSLTLRDDRFGAPTQPLWTEVAALDVFACSFDFAIENTAPVLTLGNLPIEAVTAQIGTSGLMVLGGDIWVGYPDAPDTMLLLAAGLGMRGAGRIEAGQAFLYALDGGIGASGDPLSLDMGHTQNATIAALGGDMVLDLPFGVTADVITAAQGTVSVTSDERIRVDLVGSLEEPEFRVPAGSEIGPWGGPAFDMAEVTGLGALLRLAGLNTDADVPAPPRHRPVTMAIREMTDRGMMTVSREMTSRATTRVRRVRLIAGRIVPSGPRTGGRASERAPALSVGGGDMSSKFEREMGAGMTPVRRAIGQLGPDEKEDEDDSEG